MTKNVWDDNGRINLRRFVIPGNDASCLCHAEERSICMQSFLRCGICAEDRSLLRRDDKKMFGMTKNDWNDKARVNLRRFVIPGADASCLCHAEERSICMRSFLSCGICAEDRSLLRRDDKENWDDKKIGMKRTSGSEERGISCSAQASSLLHE